MKKILIASVLAFAGITTAEAQVSFKPGVRGGVNLAKITQVESDFKADFYAGIFGELKFGKLYSLQPELTYTRQGGAGITFAQYDYDLQREVFHKEDVSFSYISFSVVNKLNLPGGLNFQLGPTFDILADSGRYANTEVDLAFVFGIGYNITNNLAVEARVKKGIADVFEPNYYYYTSDNYYDDYNTNFLFQLGVSYSFDLSHE